MSKRIAIVGGGIAGLTAAHALVPRHHITLFEKSDRVGGNAYTLHTRDGERVDIAVAAFGRAGYPRFYGLLAEHAIATSLCANSYMSFHNLDSGEGLYLTLTLAGLKSQRFDFLRPQHCLSGARLFWGLHQAQKLLSRGELEGLTLAQCLERVPAIRKDTQLILMCALCLLSSMSAEEVLNAPAAFFLEKLRHHHDVISPKFIYSVRCVKEGTERYVHALADRFKDRIVYQAQIQTILRSPQGVAIVMRDGQVQEFDDVILACNADQAYDLLEQPSPLEHELLRPWRFKEGHVVVHRDHQAFPPKSLIQAYTFLYTHRQGRMETSVNGASWHEPQVSPASDYIIAQHPNYAIRPELVEFETHLRTPIFAHQSCATIPRLPSLNGYQHTYFCGSYFGFGLHEDAVASAMAVAEFFKAP